MRSSRSATSSSSSTRPVDGPSLPHSSWSGSEASSACLTEATGAGVSTDSCAPTPGWPCARGETFVRATHSGPHLEPMAFAAPPAFHQLTGRVKVRIGIRIRIRTRIETRRRIRIRIRTRTRTRIRSIVRIRTRTRTRITIRIRSRIETGVWIRMRTKISTRTRVGIGLMLRFGQGWISWE